MLEPDSERRTRSSCALPRGAGRGRHPLARPATRAALAGALAVCLGATAAAQQQIIPNSKPFQRLKHFYAQRQYPAAHTPFGAQQQAWQQAEQKAAREQAAVPAGEAAVPLAAWVEIGPKPLATGSDAGEVSGRVSALAVDPRNSATVYMGAADGGVWKTTDGGVNWLPLTDAMPSLSVGAIAIAASAPDTVYVGLGEGYEGFDFYYGMGLLKSTDAGAHWTNIPGPFYPGPLNRASYWGGAHIGALVVKPNDANTVLAGVEMIGDSNPLDHSGIWRSTDGGVNWTLVLGGAPGTRIIFDSLDPSVAYAAIGFAGEAAWGVYKSRDAGATWTRVNGVSARLPASDVGRIALAVQHTSGQNAVLYAAVAEDAYNGAGGLRGIYKASDDGVNALNWTRLANAADFCTPQCWYDNVLAVHPADPNVIYAGGADGSRSLYRSLDGGATWSGIRLGADGQGLHADQHALEFSSAGTVLYIGNDGGAWKTTATRTSPVTYTNLNHTLSTVQFYPGLAVHPSDPRVGIGGAQDNGVELYGGSLLWHNAVACDGGWSAIDPQHPGLMYASCELVSPLRSTDAGAHWGPAASGIPPDEVSGYIAPFVMDPQAPSTLYLGTYRVWRTTDGAGTWSAISGDLGKSAGAAVLTTLAIAPGDSAVIYAGTSDGNVQVTNSALASAGAVSWTPRISGLPNRVVTSFAVSAEDPAVAYATFSGFSYGSDTLGHVFKTTDGGVTWTDISGTGATGLPNSPANAIVIDPDIRNRLYLATDVGVFRSDDDGANWTTAGTGLPRAAVVDLKLHRASRTLRAATHGRGMWDLAVAAPAVAVDYRHRAKAPRRKSGTEPAAESIGTAAVAPAYAADVRHRTGARRRKAEAVPGAAVSGSVGMAAADQRHRSKPTIRKSQPAQP